MTTKPSTDATAYGAKRGRQELEDWSLNIWHRLSPDYVMCLPPAVHVVTQ